MTFFCLCDQIKHFYLHSSENILCFHSYEKGQHRNHSKSLCLVFLRMLPRVEWQENTAAASPASGEQWNTQATSASMPPAAREQADSQAMAGTVMAAAPRQRASPCEWREGAQNPCSSRVAIRAGGQEPLMRSACLISPVTPPVPSLMQAYPHRFCFTGKE